MQMRMRTRQCVSAAVLAVILGASASGQTRPATTTQAAGGAGRGRGPALPALAVTADHADWNYVPGEVVKFSVTAPAGTAVTYTIGPEMMPAESKTEVVPAGGVLVLDGGTMKVPGFLRCVATATGFGRGLATAGFSPGEIKPTQTEPADFDAFWTKAKAELAAVPMDAKLTPLPQYATEKSDVFELNLQNIGTPPAATSRFYGILYVPKGEGPFPAMMSPPGAGVRGPDRDALGWADRGFIVVYVGIHEIPAVPGAASVPAPGNYGDVGLDDPGHYYFRRVVMGCLRANDYLVSHPKWDKKNLVAYGGSQGGYLSLATAGLDPRVTAVAAAYPAYCDESGYVHGRPAGWPGMKFANMADPQRAAKIATTAYFDGVNFARRIKAPGHYAWGYNDETCPPTSTFSAYNVITAPKELSIFKEMGHPRIPALTEAQRDWMAKHVKN